MSAHHVNAQIEGLTGGLLVGMMIAAERGADAARARHAQRQDIHAHNAGVARARADRRRKAAVVAAQVAVGEQRMARWIDRVAH